jgi:hypothetical protein
MNSEGTVPSDLSTAAGNTVASGSQLGPPKSCSTGKHSWCTTMKVKRYGTFYLKTAVTVRAMLLPQWRNYASMVIIQRWLFCTLQWVKRYGILALRSTATVAVKDKSWYELVVLVSMCKIGIPVFIAVIFV